MPTTGTNVSFRTALTNPDTGEPQDATGAVTLTLIEPFADEAGAPIEHKLEGEAIHHEGEEGSGKYLADYVPEISGGWHYIWKVNGQAVSEGDFEMESKRRGVVDLTDLRVMVPRARRKVEGPWGNPAGRAALTDDEIYAMVADACGDVVMLAGSLFRHELIVKTRDALGGYPTEWKTNTKLSEWEVAIITSQVALNYYYFLFRDMKVSESIKNEGTEWAYSLSANVIRNYLETLVEERDKAINGLRANMPVLDRYASNIRVRDQATVAVLEWWDINSPGISGSGLPGGQEASVVPWFPGAEGGLGG